MNAFLRKVLGTKVSGRAAGVTSVVRIIVGVLFVFFGAPSRT